MTDHKPPVQRTQSQSVAAFLKKAAAVPALAPGTRRGRLIFAMDATASRGPTWAQAMAIQTEMFQEAALAGGLDVQLVYYRGLMDFGASPWMNDAARMMALMGGVEVMGGQTQIQRVLHHALAASKAGKVNAVVFIGDAVEEPADALTAVAGQLALRGVPVFVFHEGGQEPSGGIFRQIASITQGAYSAFDGRSAQQLRDLLRAVAVFAAGGRKALEDFGRKAGGEVLRLTRQISGKG